MSQSSSQGAPSGPGRKGRKKALLIAVRRVKGIKAQLRQAHDDARELRELLISQFFSLYAEPCNLTYMLQTSLSMALLKMTS
jgi:hypothetical protein